MMQLRDILSPRLSSHLELQTRSPTLRRVYQSPLHEVSLALYPSGLVTALVHYLREDLRIMIGLPSATESPTPDPEKLLTAAIEKLNQQGQGPMHLVLRAKLEAGQVLTLHDRAALKLAGVEIPKEAGRFKDLF